MNASVTKSAKKTSVAKKTTAAPASKAKPAEKSGLKAVAAKLAQGIKSALKSASKAGGVKKAAAPAAKKAAAKTAGGTTTKPAAKTTAAKGAPKATGKPAAAKAVAGKSAKRVGATERKSTKASTASSAAMPVAAAKVSTAISPRASEPPAKADSPAAKTAAPMSASKATRDFVDKIQEPVVSKVTEVATKTMKSTPAAPQDGALLTEEQILQMSEKDYMNEAQLAFFKARLQALEKELLKNAGETTEHLRETVLVPDPADRATIEEEHALELRTRDRERKLLKKVQQSLAAIESGDYGWCEETGEPIGIPRLLARPTATLSLEAQQRRELKQKLYGD